MVKFVMYVIDTKSIAMLKLFDEKGKLVEKSGRKATNLSLQCKGRYGSRAAMEKEHIYHANFLGKSYSVRRLS